MGKPTVIDLTPTWASLVSSLVLLIERGTPEARAFAIEELKRMAERADKATLGKALRPLPDLMLHMARNTR
jgi:hypothetical protein